MSCMTTLFLNLHITSSDIWPHIKRAVSLVIAYGHFDFPQGFVWVRMVYILTLSPQRAGMGEGRGNREGRRGKKWEDFTDGYDGMGGLRL